MWKPLLQLAEGRKFRERLISKSHVFQFLAVPRFPIAGEICIVVLAMARSVLILLASPSKEIETLHSYYCFVLLLDKVDISPSPRLYVLTFLIGLFLNLVSSLKLMIVRL